MLGIAVSDGENSGSDSDESFRNQERYAKLDDKNKKFTGR